MDDIRLFEILKEGIEDEINGEYTKQKERLLEEMAEALERKRAEFVQNAIALMDFQAEHFNFPEPKVVFTININKE